VIPALDALPLLAVGSRIEDVNAFAYFAAFGGGVISFLSPCVLPLVPGYVSMITGLDLATLRDDPKENSARIAGTTGLFILGFGSVFMLLGLSASKLGQAVVRNQEILTRISGAVMLGMAMFLIGSLFLQAPWLYQERRFHPQVDRFGHFAPVVMGAAFAFGWSPCLGPILGSILGIAATQDRAWAGATLLLAYTLGLGLPFLLVGLTLGRVGPALSFVKRHMRGIVLVSALVLAFFGFLLLTDQLSRLTASLVRYLDRLGLDGLVDLG